MVLPCWTQRSTAAARPYSRSSGCAATQSARDQDSSKEGRRCSCDRRSLTLSRYTRLRRHDGQGSGQVPVVHDGTSGDRRLPGEEHMSLLLPHVHAYRLDPFPLPADQLATEVIIQRLLLPLPAEPQRLARFQIAQPPSETCLSCPGRFRP